MSKNIIQTQYWLELAYKATQEENENALNTLLNKTNIIIDNISVLKGLENSRIIDFAIGANLFSQKEWNSFINYKQNPDEDPNYYLALIPEGIIVEPLAESEGNISIDNLSAFVELYTDTETEISTIRIDNMMVNNVLVNDSFKTIIEAALKNLGVEWWQEALIQE